MTIRIILLLSTLLPCISYSQSIPHSERIHWNRGRGYAPFRHATPEGILIRNTSDSLITDIISLPTPLDDYTISFRAAETSANLSRQLPYKSSSPQWITSLVSSSNDTLNLIINTEEIPDPLSSSLSTKISLTTSGSSTPLLSTIVNDGLDCFSGTNCWQISASSDHIALYAGNRMLNPIGEIPNPISDCKAFGFAATPGAALRITDISVASGKHPGMTIHPLWSNRNHLQHYLSASKNELEGYYTVFDRTLEESQLILGGDYLMAIVEDNNPQNGKYENPANSFQKNRLEDSTTDNQHTYLLLYISGAHKNAANWKPGMIKGIIETTPFQGIYDITWYDVEGNPLFKDLKVQEGEGNTLSIQFPYQSSSLRLRKIPTPSP